MSGQRNSGAGLTAVIFFVVFATGTMLGFFSGRMSVEQERAKPAECPSCPECQCPTTSTTVGGASALAISGMSPSQRDFRRVFVALCRSCEIIRNSFIGVFCRFTSLV